MPSTFEGEVLLLNNADVEKLLTIERVLAVLDEAYLELTKDSPPTGRGLLPFRRPIMGVSWPTPTRD